MGWANNSKILKLYKNNGNIIIYVVPNKVYPQLKVLQCFRNWFKKEIDFKLFDTDFVSRNIAILTILPIWLKNKHILEIKS